MASIVVFVAQLFCHLKTYFGVALYEPQEIVSFNKVDLTRNHRFGSDIVNVAGYARGQSQYLTRLGDLHNDRLTTLLTYG